MASKPVVKILAHPSSPIGALAVSKCGNYMVSGGKDCRMKVWDIRKSYKCLYDYFTPAPPQSIDFSDTGLVGCGFGKEVFIWKNIIKEK